MRARRIRGARRQLAALNPAGDATRLFDIKNDAAPIAGSVHRYLIAAEAPILAPRNGIDWIPTMPRPRLLTQTPPLNVALLGCGRIARRFHLPILSSMPDVRVRVIADPDRRARQLARDASAGVLWLDQWEDALTVSD